MRMILTETLDLNSYAWLEPAFSVVHEIEVIITMSATPIKTRKQSTIPTHK
jgi:hypothetical protein